MRRSSYLVTLLLASTLLAGAAGAEVKPAALEPGAAPDKVIAKVNGQAIHASELAFYMERLPQQASSMPRDVVAPRVMEQMIVARLVTQAAAASDLREDPRVQEQIRLTQERILQDAWLAREVGKEITEERLKRLYAERLGATPPQDEVKAAHILVESEEEAKAIIKEIENGTDFARIAGDRSKDKAAAAQGGDLGWFTREQMVPPFAAAAFAMKPGEISRAPVQTQFGWHVIKAEDRRQASPASFEETRPELVSELRQTVLAEVLERLQAGARIERFPLDLKASSGDQGAGAATGTKVN